MHAEGTFGPGGDVDAAANRRFLRGDVAIERDPATHRASLRAERSMGVRLATIEAGTGA